MSESVFSPSWYRLADLAPRLPDHAEVHRHRYRGQLWYVIQDSSSAQFHRFSPVAYQLIGLMDGSRSVQQIWEAAATRLGDEMPTQEQVVQLLAQLHAADLLQCDVPPDTDELLRRFRQHEIGKWKRRLMSPLALRFPLLDPDRFLARWQAHAQLMFGWFGLCLWLTVVGTAAVLAGAYWSELSLDVADRVLNPQNLLLLWLIFPVVKALHELGHGFATKVWGGEVHEMGIMLLVFTPVPYVDASAASVFRHRRRRMMVGAAGIMVELFLAALALFVWVNAESGVVRAVAYNVMLIAGVSTLLFNGNPLLRFDGYYVLADALEMPNLGPRANKYIGYLVQRYLFGVREAESPATAPGERTWLLGYGVLSFCYRMFIMFVIVLFVAGKFFTIGIVLAVWALTSQLVIPAVKVARTAWTSPRLRRRRKRVLGTSGTLGLSLLALVLFMPFPWWTQTQGIVWLPEKAQVRAGADGFIKQILVRSGSLVREGQPLVVCEDPFLSARVRVLESRLRELMARYEAKRMTDRVQAEILREERLAVEADLAHARERADALLVRSPNDGTLVIPRDQDLPGRFLSQGELVAYVADPSQVTVRAMVPQGAVDLVRQRTHHVQLRPVANLSRVFNATVLRQVPGATEELPSPALGTSGGGPFVVDPTDDRGLRLVQGAFQFDLALPAGTQISAMGSRVHVRFDHGREPLFDQWYRAARQVFLKRFGV
ncbi:MAG: HlyD family efflux transporter periplasmic adaptor subunit [Gammaproteobacteria bacterium]|nr:HlyD family efflux transporter periplasmic adaptor subunit [Gammaproteobacteria bacterium]